MVRTPIMRAAFSLAPTAKIIFPTGVRLWMNHRTRSAATATMNMTGMSTGPAFTENLAHAIAFHWLMGMPFGAPPEMRSAAHCHMAAVQRVATKVGTRSTV